MARHRTVPGAAGADGIRRPGHGAIRSSGTSTGSRRSARPGEVQQELDVAVGSADRRHHRPHHGAPAVERRADDHSRSAPRQTAGSVITPRPRPTSCRPASNCGLTSTTISRPVGSSADEDADDRAQRDERQVGDHRVERRRSVASVDVTEVGALAATSTRASAPEPFVELAVADVDGDHLRGAALEQAVGEAAGRRAGVEDPNPVTSSSKRSSAASSFSPPRPTNRAARPRHDRLAGVDLSGRLVGASRADHETRPSSTSVTPRALRRPGRGAPVRRRGGGAPAEATTPVDRVHRDRGLDARPSVRNAYVIGRREASISDGQVVGHRQVGAAAAGRRRRRGDPAEHQAERPTERVGQRAVGVGLGRRPRRPPPGLTGVHQVDHRCVGFAGDGRPRSRPRSSTAARIDPHPGRRPSAAGEDGVVVRGDQSGAPARTAAEARSCRS